MAVKLNHTILHSADKQASAEFLARILGVGHPGIFGHFVTVEVANGVSLDFDNSDNVRSQHYAFLVDDADFDPIFERVKGEGVQFYADPMHHEAGRINRWNTGRGFYFSGPEGHNYEVITRPYGTS
jgi:catechol 2,3-dioxygenase-like lactoylglutathione lyase family enzyme